MTTKRISRNLTVAGGAAVALALVAASPAHAETEVSEPDSFTSAFTVMATPDQVINADGDVAAGEEGASGTFTFRINSDEEIICYDIVLTGVTGEYESPAKTATHIHQAALGEPGPPRIAFPNPVDDGSGERTSSGCLQGPFTTGIESDAGTDTGEGFTLAQIEADPAAFTGDSHTASFPAGVVRGQLSQIPVDGIDTGAGGTAAEAATGDTTALAAAGGVTALGALAAAAFVIRRRRAQA
ncbi:CHRD domain-containing protein [Labedella endophytica]|uniref:CHRD domain-containing protein n=1 Tax=Labedella endophytica TaxID=1523160 RepID=A0A3S0VCZ7_9MICO|nr:CHRD domain-containing protein [Labedella endophytica]RUR03068.1 CHRD domain-containing protein [Labedella endophytica]